MSTLIVILPVSHPSAATSCDVVIADEERKSLRHAQAQLALLPAAAGAEIVAVVPAQKLSWHRVRLPKGTLQRGPFQERNAPRLRAVLDGLLEDRVLDEPAQLHYALEPQASADNPVWVAVCERAWLQAWLAALEHAGRPVARIVPELAPPTGEAPTARSLQVLGTPEHAQVLHSGPGGVALLPLTAATAAWLGETPTGESPVPVIAEPGVAALAEQHFQRPVTLQTRPQRAATAALSAWDLAQFDLLRTRGTRLRKRLHGLSATLRHAPQWRAARWATLVLLAVNIAGVLALAWQEQAAQAAKRAAIRGILTSTFPDVRVVIDAPRQMARSLADLQRQSGTASRGDLETMLAQYQAAAPNAPVASAIEFGAGELQLKGLDPEAAPLANVGSRLRAQGYSARWQDTTLFIRAEVNP
jgi:general secretion pathway protein L